MARVSISNRLKNPEQVEHKSIPWESLAETSFQDTLKPYFANHEVVVSIVEPEEIQELNRLYRYKNQVTDVLSFNAIGNLSDDLDKFSEEQDLELEDAVLGDIVICATKAQEQAKENQHDTNSEIAFLFVHGLLHLLGYDHEQKDEAEQMFKLQNQILEKHDIGVVILGSE